MFEGYLNDNEVGYIQVPTYDVWRDQALGVYEITSTNLKIIDIKRYRICICSTPFFEIRYSVPDGSSEATQLDSDITAYWSKFPNISTFSEPVFDHNEYAVTARGANINYCARINAPSEIAVSETNIIGALTAGAAIDSYLQVFRASEDNIHDLTVVVEGVGAAASSATDDTFESYSDTAALIAVWVPSDGTNTAPTLETSVVYDGAKAMKITYAKTALSKNDTITRTFTAEDWTDFKNVRFYMRSTLLGVVWRLNISDGANTAYIEFSPNVLNQFERVYLSVDAMTNIGAVTRTAITSLSFELISSPIAATTIFDSLAVTGVPGTVEIELYDFGTTANPTTLGTPLTLDCGDTKEVVELPEKKSLLQLHLHYGSHQRSSVMTVGNYYGFRIANVSQGSCDIYGTGTSQIYSSGKFYSEDGGTLTPISNATAGFLVSVVRPAYLLKLKIRFVGVPGNGSIDLHLDDENGVTLKHIGHMILDGQSEIIFDFTAKFHSPIYTSQIRQLHAYYSDSLESTATKIIFDAEYIVEKLITYG